MEPEDQQSLPDKIFSETNSITEKPNEEIRRRLIFLINELINKDFYALLQLLYRVDVDEKKISICLDKNFEKDAALVFADLIIERQIQKIETRKQFSKPRRTETDEEEW
ncbi:MAG: hypothetical protein ABI297_05420 [Ginsengibacter sp.]